MKKKLTKILACILCISTIVTSIPITSKAAKTTDVSATTVNKDSDAKQEKAEIVTEIKSERSADTKTFLMSDGSYFYAVYPEQVHYRENNQWVDVDNSLEKTSDDDGSAVLENKKNPFNIKFSNKAKNKKLVSLKSGKYQLDWALANAHKVSAEEVKFESGVTDVALKNVNSGVVYKEILPDVDLQYVIDASSVKEDIILKKSTAQHEFVFEYQVKKLTYQANSDGSISFYAEDNIEDAVYTLDKPFMYDANGKTSDAIKVTVEKTKKGFSLKLTADSEWLNASERSYPVTIDPTIVTEQVATAVKDTTGVLSSKTNALYEALEGGSNKLWLKVGSFFNTDAYALVYVPLPSNISDSCRILEAKLNLITYRAGISTCSSNLTISANEITTDWNQNNIYNNDVLYGSSVPNYDYKSTDFIILNDSSTSSHNQLYSLDITKVAQKWATGASVNRGILLKGEDLPATERYMRFYDSDNSLRNSDPCFTYVYRDTKGVEDYWTYTTMTAGRNGTTAVNNFNGNMVVTQNITGMSGNRMPVSISAFYDSSSRSSNANNLGLGWKTNYNMKICTSSLPQFPYYLIDSDGTEHYFYGESTASEWEDEDGLGYTLKKDSSVYSGGYVITDKGKNKTYFRSDGKLGRMDDTFGNHITVNYDSSARISSITDGAGRVYTFSYNSAGNISSITNPASKTVTFTYDGSSNLTKIQYADSKSTTFSYGSNGLYQVTSPDGTYTKMVYNLVANHLYTSSLEYYGSNNTLNTDYDFVYGHNNTTITSNCDNTINHTYQFDNFGKTTGVVNNISQTAEYYSYGAPGGSNSGKENKLLSASATIQAPMTYMHDNDSYSNSSKWYLHASSNNTNMSIDNTFGNQKAPSLKIQQTNANGGYSAVVYDAGVLKGGFKYTFGVFLNTKGETLPVPEGISFSVYAEDPNAEWAEYAHTTGGITMTLEEEWRLSQASFEVYEDSHYYIVIGGYFEGAGAFWLDDLHIQLGDLYQGYNYLNDTYFMNGGASWTYRRNNNVATDDSVTYYETLCASIEGSFYEKRSVSQTVNCSGKAGDSIIFGSWAVGYSVPTGVKKPGVGEESTFRVRLEMEGPSGKATFSNNSNILDFNDALEEWQFVSGSLIAPIDYTSITLYFDYDYNTWFSMFNRAFVCKDLFGQSYTYDSNGNVVSVKDLSETEASFAYQNNNLSQMLDPSGTRYSYAYDETTNALMYANSSYGQLYAFTYDEYGNALSSTVSESNNSTQVADGSVYYIRNVTTGNAMKESSTGLVNGTYATQNNSIRWKLIATDEEDVYYIQPQSDASKYLAVENGSTADKAKIVLSAASTSDSQKFKIHYNNDGTFYILSKVSNYTKAIDGRDLNNGSSTALNKGMVQNTKDTTSGNQKWYFSQYVENPVAQGTVSTSSTYTSNGNYLSSTTDELNHTTNYTYNSDGTLKNVTDAKSNITNYTYDSSNGNLTSVSAGGSTNKYTYENDKIKTIETPNGTIYTFNYDAYGRNESIQLNRKNSTATPRTLVTYMYHSEATDFATNGSGNNLSQVTYANGEFYNMFYDKVGRVEAVNNSNYFYDKNGNVMERMPGGFNESGTIYYNYDLAGRVVNKTVSGRWEGTVTYALSYKYLNQKNLLEKYRFATTTDDFETSFVYGNMNNGQIADAVYGVKLNNVQKIGYNYDELARQNQRTLYAGNSEITTSYGFKTFDDGSTSYLIDTVTENGYTYSYTYDAVGNITEYTKKNATTNEVVETYVYQYDSKNQLTYVGSDLTSGISYTYDANGNILTKTDHSKNETVSYGYTDPTWADLLTSYNGQAITYDEGGNPLQYNNGTAMELSWIFGRRLFTVNIGDTEIMYAYDQEGIRTSKTIGDAYTKYHIIDGVMYGEKTTDADGTTEIFYFYDDNDRKYGFSYEGTMYYYQYNLQGDVTGIYDANGQLVVEYKYDAWGKVLAITGSLATTIGQYNPIRYRGYYYDNETGFYYLNSRYYDPETGRFLNADSLINQDYVVGNNMFAYCLNNPVNMTDSTGNLPFFVVTAVIGAVAGAVIGGVVAAKNGGNVWAGIGIGATAGALIGTGVGMVAGAALAGSITATTGMVTAGVSSLVATISTGGIGAALGTVGNNLSQATKTAPDPLSNALNQLDRTGLRPGQTEISRAKVMDIANRFDITKAQSSIYSNGNTRFLVDGHHTTVASVIAGKGPGINMGMVTDQLPSATNIYWTKKWYEFGKTVIKIVD